jgi:putative membrane protein
MMLFILRAVVAAVGLWISTKIFTGLAFDGPWTLVLAAALLGIVNAIVRPIAVVLTLPLTLLSLGLFLVVINAGMLALVAWLLDGFTINSFWTALGASIVVSITSWAASGLLGNNGKLTVAADKR